MPRLPAHIRGISLDFANTIYPLRGPETASTIRHLHAFLERRLDKKLPDAMLHDLYVEIRERQFAENRDSLRENDFPARLREMITRVYESPSDALVDEASNAYEDGFIKSMVLPEGTLEIVQELSACFQGKIAVCSNFILNRAIIEPLRRDGILPLLASVIVSCDVGFVKPHPLLFERVSDALGVPAHQIVHVGDDLDADILGARQAGMTTVYTTQWCEPVSSAATKMASPDFRVSHLGDLVKLMR